MSALASLKLTAAQKPHRLPQVVQRRNKLLKRLWEQIELAKAQQAGTQFTVSRLRSYTDKDTGVRRQVESLNYIKCWWFTTEAGKLAVSVRYGAKILELTKGKYAAEVGSQSELIPTLQVIKTAVESGELDAAIEAAANKLKVGFKPK